MGCLLLLPVLLFDGISMVHSLMLRILLPLFLWIENEECIYLISVGFLPYVTHSSLFLVD